MSTHLRHLAVLCVFSAVLSTPAPVSAHKGMAAGRTVLIDGLTKVYGFSSSVGAWSSTTLDSAIRARMVGAYIGYVRTGTRVLAYNSTTNSWFSTAFSGDPLSEGVEGTTAVFWTTQACYGISTIWALWRSVPLANPLGGGSGGSYGLVWTPSTAYAYSAATGQWSSQALIGESVGGHASSGLGLVWTDRAIYVFDPVSRLWSSQEINNPEGISVDGSGKVGVVWSLTVADAYSAYLGAWAPLPGTNQIEGGAAGDEVAVLWNADEAFAFDPHVGTWVQIAIEAPTGAPSAPGEPDGLFSVGPNPSSGAFSIRIPSAAEPWKIEIVGIDGARIRRMECAADVSGGSEIVWDQTDEESRPVPAGTYWVHAQAGGRVEARRIVVLR